MGSSGLGRSLQQSKLPSDPNKPTIGMNGIKTGYDPTQNKSKVPVLKTTIQNDRKVIKGSDDEEEDKKYAERVIDVKKHNMEGDKRVDVKRNDPESDEEGSDQGGDSPENERKPEIGSKLFESQAPQQEESEGEEEPPQLSNQVSRGPPTLPMTDTQMRNRQETEQEEIIEIVVAKLEDLNLTNMKWFVLNPPPKGKMMQCTIMRDKTKLIKKFSPKYHVYLSGTQSYLMTGKKRGVKASSSYYVGTEKSNFDKDANHLAAKLKSNFWGTQFNIFDMGENPSKTSNLNQMRSELGVVKYVEVCDFRRRIG